MIASVAIGLLLTVLNVAPSVLYFQITSFTSLMSSVSAAMNCDLIQLSAPLTLIASPRLMVGLVAKSVILYNLGSARIVRSKYAMLSIPVGNVIVTVSLVV